MGAYIFKQLESRVRMSDFLKILEFLFCWFQFSKKQKIEEGNHLKKEKGKGIQSQADVQKYTSADID